MSVTREFAKTQIARMGNLDFSAQNAIEAKEIQNALMACDNEVQCKDIVSDWIRENSAFPKPSHIYAILESRRRASSSYQSLGEKPTPNCCRCDDWGTYNDEKEQPQWCDCRAGNQLQEDQPEWLELAGKLKRKTGYLKTLNPGTHRSMEILKR